VTTSVGILELCCTYALLYAGLGGIFLASALLSYLLLQASPTRFVYLEIPNLRPHTLVNGSGKLTGHATHVCTKKEESPSVVAAWSRVVPRCCTHVSTVDITPRAAARRVFSMGA
jgi:hypothetical protein